MSELTTLSQNIRRSKARRLSVRVFQGLAPDAFVQVPAAGRPGLSICPQPVNPPATVRVSGTTSADAGAREARRHARPGARQVQGHARSCSVPWKGTEQEPMQLWLISTTWRGN